METPPPQEGAAAPMMGPPPGGFGQQEMMAKLQAILATFEVTIAEASDLMALKDYEIVVICDDSGSMNMPTEAPKTRWDEQKETVSLMVDLASCFDENGIDIYFLNRAPLHGVQHALIDPSFQSAFAQPPAGLTPLTERLMQVAQAHSSRKTIIIVLTDGEPTGGSAAFGSAVRQVTASGMVKIQVMACTSAEDEIAWLSVLDRQLKELDVTDDYRSEKQEVIRSGRVQKFTRGDWCMKAMLGPVSTKFDGWDEGKRTRVADDCCCTVQ